MLNLFLPFLSIFVLPNTYSLKRNSNTHLQEDLPLLVDHWLEQKYNNNLEEQIPDQTAFLDVGMKNLVPEKKFGVMLILIGDTPNKKMIMIKLSYYEDFLSEKIMAKSLPLTNAPLNASVYSTEEPT